MVAVQDGVCHITYRLGENAPHLRAGLPTKAQTQQHEKDTEFGELGAGL